MSNHCDSPCGHTHIKNDIPRCQTIVTHNAVTHIKYDICLCQIIVTHHAVTHILNMTYLDVKPLCLNMRSHTHILIMTYLDVKPM